MIESDFLDLLDEAQRVCGKDPVDLAAYLGTRIPEDDPEARAAAIEAIFRYTGTRPNLAGGRETRPAAADVIDVTPAACPRCGTAPADGPDSTGFNYWCVPCERWFARCEACGVCYASPQSPYCKDGHDRSLSYHPFIPYFDYGLGKEITTLAERWTAMKGTPDEDYGHDRFGHERPGVKGTPRLDYRDHPSKGELAARRDRIEHANQERRRGHRP
jgi:hypothetical protein